MTVLDERYTESRKNAVWSFVCKMFEEENPETMKEGVYRALSLMQEQCVKLKAENERLSTIVSALKASTDFYQSAIEKYQEMQKEVTK